MKKHILIILLAVTAIIAIATINTSCKKHNMLGSFQVSFTFSWDGKDFTAADLDKYTHPDMIIGFDTTIVTVMDTINNSIDTTINIDTIMGPNTAISIRIFDTTASTNLVNFNEIKFFLYGISFVDVDGNYYSIDGDSIHYIDIRTPSTLSWHSAEKIPTGIYDSIIFHFGLSEADNVVGRFTDPPEVNMDWPGKGYHFMKIEGRWQDINQDVNDTITNGFNLHIRADKGIRLALAHRFYLTEEGVVKKSFNMALDKWFNVTPAWDFNVYGGEIMHNSEAQKVLLDRVDKVFSVK